MEIMLKELVTGPIRLFRSYPRAPVEVSNSSQCKYFTRNQEIGASQAM